METFPFVDPGCMFSKGIPNSSHLFISSRKQALLLAEMGMLKVIAHQTTAGSIPSNSRSSAEALPRLTGFNRGVDQPQRSRKANRRGWRAPTQVIAVGKQAIGGDAVLDHLLGELLTHFLSRQLRWSGEQSRAEGGEEAAALNVGEGGVVLEACATSMCAGCGGRTRPRSLPGCPHAQRCMEGRPLLLLCQPWRERADVIDK